MTIFWLTTEINSASQVNSAVSHHLDVNIQHNLQFCVTLIPIIILSEQLSVIVFCVYYLWVPIIWYSLVLCVSHCVLQIQFPWIRSWARNEEQEMLWISSAQLISPSHSILSGSFLHFWTSKLVFPYVAISSHDRKELWLIQGTGNGIRGWGHLAGQLWVGLAPQHPP